jgi:hypothetical protein
MCPLRTQEAVFVLLWERERPSVRAGGYQPDVRLLDPAADLAAR